MDRDQALFDWLKGNADLNATLLFNFLSEKDGDMALIVAPESQAPQNIDGSRERRYLFYLQLMRPLSQTTDDINVESMKMLRIWMDWLDEQEEAGNYPDFGPKCSCYELSNLADNPQLAMTYTEDQKAKYQFAAQITYLEDK